MAAEGGSSLREALHDHDLDFAQTETEINGERRDEDDSSATSSSDGNDDG